MVVVQTSGASKKVVISVVKSALNLTYQFMIIQKLASVEYDKPATISTSHAIACHRSANSHIHKLRRVHPIHPRAVSETHWLSSQHSHCLHSQRRLCRRGLIPAVQYRQRFCFKRMGLRRGDMNNCCMLGTWKHWTSCTNSDMQGASRAWLTLDVDLLHRGGGHQCVSG